MASKLIILRGPSGSGKTTIANELFNCAKNPIVLIDQDHFRFIFRPPGAGGMPNAHTISRMIKSSVLIALDDGYDVILEGILGLRRYRTLLDELFASHPRDNHLFYFNVSLDESIRRHHTKPDTNGFGEEDLRAWYPASGATDLAFECLIPEHYSVGQTMAFVVAKTGLDLV